MEHLVFQLQAPLAAWGEPAVGETRASANYPGQAAIIGLLGAALGIDRSSEASHAAFFDSYAMAVGVLSTGQLLRDYHTAQVPARSALKGRPHATRAHELAVGKQHLNTILSTRDYRQNAACLVALAPRMGTTAPHSLSDMAQALRRPKFVLYLGRKACAPAAPLWPQCIEAVSAYAAFTRYFQQAQDAMKQAASLKGHYLLSPLPPLELIAFDDHIQAGLPAELTARRKDQLIHRGSWQFCDRNEHIAWLDTTPTPVKAED